MTNNMSLAEAMDKIADATANHIRITNNAKTSPRFATNLLIARMEARILNHAEEHDDSEVGEYIDMVLGAPGPLLMRSIREAADRKVVLLSGYGDDPILGEEG